MRLFEDLTKHQFKLKGGKIWTLTQAKYDEWIKSYTTYDVEGEIRKAKQWLSDNPRRRKTAKGMVRFISAWIARSEETGHITDAPEVDRTEQVRQNNIKSYISDFVNIINSWAVEDLLRNKSFRHACGAYPEVKAWALEQRPELRP